MQRYIIGGLAAATLLAIGVAGCPSSSGGSSFKLGQAEITIESITGSGSLGEKGATVCVNVRVPSLAESMTIMVSTDDSDNFYPNDEETCLYIGQPMNSTDPGDYDFDFCMTPFDCDELTVDLLSGDGADYPGTNVKVAINTPFNGTGTITNFVEVAAFFEPVSADSFEPNDTTPTATRISLRKVTTDFSLGVVQGATIFDNPSPDCDWYTFTITAQRDILLLLAAPGSGSIMFAELFDSSSSSLTTVDTSGSSKLGVFRLAFLSQAAAGTYFIKVNANTPTDEGGYILAVETETP